MCEPFSRHGPRIEALLFSPSLLPPDYLGMISEKSQDPAYNFKKQSILVLSFFFLLSFISYDSIIIMKKQYALVQLADILSCNTGQYQKINVHMVTSYWQHLSNTMFGYNHLRFFNLHF